MYRIKLKRVSKNEFDEVIELEKENKAHFEYCQYMNQDYYFGSLSKLVEGKEQNIASFCNSKFANVCE